MLSILKWTKPNCPCTSYQPPAHTKIKDVWTNGIVASVGIIILGWITWVVLRAILHLEPVHGEHHPVLRSMAQVAVHAASAPSPTSVVALRKTQALRAKKVQGLNDVSQPTPGAARFLKEGGDGVKNPGQA